MFAIVLAIVVLGAAVGAIVLLLKSMGQDGIEIAAPGSCKSGRCGVACKQPAADDAANPVIEIAEPTPPQRLAAPDNRQA